MNKEHFVNKDDFIKLRKNWEEILKDKEAVEKINEKFLPSLKKLNHVFGLVTISSHTWFVLHDLEVVCCCSNKNGLEGLERIFQRITEYIIKDKATHLLSGLSLEKGFRNSPLFPKPDSQLVKVHYDKPILVPVYILNFKLVYEKDFKDGSNYLIKAIKSL